MMKLIDFPTLPYDHVTNSFLLEIWFWGPTNLTFSYNAMSLFLILFFYFELFPKEIKETTFADTLQIQIQTYLQFLDIIEVSHGI